MQHRLPTDLSAIAEFLANLILNSIVVGETGLKFEVDNNALDIEIVLWSLTCRSVLASQESTATFVTKPNAPSFNYFFSSTRYLFVLHNTALYIYIALRIVKRGDHIETAHSA